MAFDEVLSPVASEPFTAAVELKAKVDTYLALQEEVTELKLLNKTIADVPLDTQQKLCAAMGEQLNRCASALPTSGSGTRSLPPRACTDASRDARSTR